MDMLEYMERETAATLKVVMDDYAATHARAYNFVTLLVGGGGAVGAYVLNKISTPVPTVSWLPLGVLALYWMLIAAGILLFGLQSNYLSNGPRPSDLGNYFSTQGGDFGDATTTKNLDALTQTRMAELVTRGERISDYMTAVGNRAQVLNAGYVAAALSPAPALISLLFT
nr:hypothetical protein [uncultured Albidiferax sp.]